MRITLVIPSLDRGGAERVLSELANYLVRKNHHVTLVTLSSPSCQPSYPLDPRVVLHQTHSFSAVTARPITRVIDAFGRLYKLRKAILASRPQVVLSFIDVMNITTLLAMKGTKIPTIVAERVDPNHHRIPRPYDWLRRKIYPQSFRLVVQTNDALGYFSKALQKKSKIIANPSFFPSSSGKIILQDPKVILSVGRLVPQKDHVTLIQAMAKVITRFPAIVLKIHGKGPLHAQLQILINTLGLEKNVFLAGMTSDTEKALQETDLFVLPSLYEGFPNALMEAMAMGVPCIASNCSGNRDLIDPNQNGHLFPVGNHGALAEKMIALLENPAQRQLFSENGQKKAQTYGPDIIFSEWESLLIDACEAHSHMNGNAFVE